MMRFSHTHRSVMKANPPTQHEKICVTANFMHYSSTIVRFQVLDKKDGDGLGTAAAVTLVLSRLSHGKKVIDEHITS